VVEGYRGLADTPSRLEGAEHEIDKWYGLTTKPAYLPFIESLRTGSIPVPTAIFICMACHCLHLKDSREFYSLLKARDPEMILKMVKCVLSAYKRNKPNIDIFDITFKNMDELTFNIEKSQYKELLGNCLNDLIAMEEYELCAEVKKIIEGKRRNKVVEAE
jgi:hypothetical protein